MLAEKPGTDALFDPDRGIVDTFGGPNPLPRSIASDGRRTVLALHVLVHVAALGFNIAASVQAYETFSQTRVQTGVIVAVAVHSVGILCLLALAASEIKQVAFVLSVSFILWALFTSLLASVAMLAFAYHAEDLLTTEHGAGTVSVILQTLGISMLIANALNMAANADVAFSGNAEVTLLTAEETA